jgi:16S rRNA (cytosine1402-N4)-methyltransferase
MISGGGAADESAAGGPARHVPVLREAVLATLAPRSGGLYLDATFGAGGYTRAILNVPGTRLLALDRDPSAIAAGSVLVSDFAPRLTVAEARFGDLERVALQHGFTGFDGIVFDVGVSSMQLDDEHRGFSFRGEGPLDMRMASAGPSAADLVNGADEATLADILFHWGEERAARRIARAIVADRVKQPFLTTRSLADMIARVVPGKPNEIHPATRSFQALRIAVNDELGELLRGLDAASRVLTPGGRLVVVTFHSLEDRIVKQYLTLAGGRGAAASRHLPTTAAAPVASFTVPGRQPVLPSPSEISDNPRARSAKLRWGVRTEAAALPIPDQLRALVELPTNRQRRR